jgi:RNA polymerase sigma factor (sigma-70 family)
MRIPPFSALLDEHHVEVFRFLVAAVGRQEAEDCFQETFLAALRAYPRLRHGRNLRAWLLTIAHRKALDNHRARARALAAPRDEVSAASAPLDPDVKDALGRLSPKQRLALLHRYLLDLPYAQVAGIMGTTEAAARRNVHEGIKRLRRMWSE